MKAIYVVVLLLTLVGIRYGNAQHCTPGFHFTVEGYTVMFDDHSTADGDITDYHWDFGDGQTSQEQNPDHTYAHSGTYNVCLTITAHNPGCTATFCQHVVIHDPPPGNCHAAFTAHQPDLHEQLIDFTDGSTSDGTITSWSWDFGDGNSSTQQNPSHIYQSPGTYLVCLHITDDTGCADHFCHEVIVHDPPPGHCQASYTYHQPDINAPVVEFTDQSTSDGTITYWSWDFANGPLSVEQNPTVTFPGPGVYVVCLYIEDDAGCTSHFCHDVVVHHPPVGECQALFTAHQPDINEPVIQFTDVSTSDGHIVSWMWVFGPFISTEQHPVFTFEGPGVYLVCLYISDDMGCTSHFCHEVIVHHPAPAHCDALFAAHQIDPTELTINFADLSTADDPINSWLWDFGDGTTSTEQHPAHTYNLPGIYLVCLFITDDGGCTSHYCHHVTLHHVPADVDNSAQRLGLDHAHAASKVNSTDLPTSSSLHSRPAPRNKEFYSAYEDRPETYLSIFPNPVYGNATITYMLSVKADVRIELYDLNGEMLMQKVLLNQRTGLDSHSIPTENLQAGTYFVRMVAGDEVISKKVVVVK